MSNKLTDKIALVTGGSKGIGLATAKRFVDEGAYVFITGRNQADLDAAVKEIGRNVTAIQADASDLNALDNLFGEIKESKGRLDVLFVNAGGGELVPLDQVTEEHFDRTFNTNVKGLLFTVQKALPIFTDGGSIILNASIVATKGFPALSVYSATKAAVRSFARTWTVDLQTRHIRVNSVSPGPIQTPGLDGIFTDQEAKAQMGASVPLGRIGNADEIAQTVTFLASDESSFITGSDFTVDGGLAQI